MQDTGRRFCQRQHANARDNYRPSTPRGVRTYRHAPRSGKERIGATGNTGRCSNRRATMIGDCILIEQAGQHSEQVLLAPAGLKALVLDANLARLLLLEQIQGDVS